MVWIVCLFGCVCLFWLLPAFVFDVELSLLMFVVTCFFVFWGVVEKPRPVLAQKATTFHSLSFQFAVAISHFEMSGSKQIISAAVVASGAASSVEEKRAQLSLVQRALAYRAKHRISDTPVRVAPQHIGFHPRNRSGQGVSAERCTALLKRILKDGFSPSLADCDGVLVQEKPGKTQIHDYNMRICADEPSLAALVMGQTLTHGSVAHSHLNQLFKNALSAVAVGIPEIEDPQGGISMTLLARVDPNFASYCSTGLLWEILAPSVNDDGDALDVIQAAANAQNNAGMTAHEVEAILRISELCVRSATKQHQISYDGVQAAVAATLPEMAGHPDFVELFKFVINLGGGNAQFCSDLSKFVSKVVDPQAMGWERRVVGKAAGICICVRTNYVALFLVRGN